MSGGTDGSVRCSSRKACRRVCTRLRSRAAFAAAGRPPPERAPPAGPAGPGPVLPGLESRVAEAGGADSLLVIRGLPVGPQRSMATSRAARPANDGRRGEAETPDGLNPRRCSPSATPARRPAARRVSGRSQRGGGFDWGAFASPRLGRRGLRVPGLLRRLRRGAVPASLCARKLSERATREGRSRKRSPGCELARASGMLSR